MQYEIVLESEQKAQYVVIERNNYNGEDLFFVHSRHDELETAQLVKEALEARAARN